MLNRFHAGHVPPTHMLGFYREHVKIGGQGGISYGASRRYPCGMPNTILLASFSPPYACTPPSAPRAPLFWKLPSSKEGTIPCGWARLQTAAGRFVGAYVGGTPEGFPSRIAANPNPKPRALNPKNLIPKPSKP